MRSFAVGTSLITAAAAAQPVQTRRAALAEDAIQYAARFGVSPDEALRRLEAQQASVAATDTIAAEFADRLAGIAIDTGPDYRIVVLLTGAEPVAEREAAGVPILFRTGAKATHAQALAALRKHLIDVRSALPALRGAGFDQRTGEIVLLVTGSDAARFGLEAIRAQAEQVGGVPVRVVVNDLIESDMSIAAGPIGKGIGALQEAGSIAITPSQPRRRPITSQPRSSADRTTDRMQASGFTSTRTSSPTS